MKYFLDTEFIESPGSIQLISIGLVCEDGRTFYAENTSFDENDADEWVKKNVIDKLRWWQLRHAGGGRFYDTCNGATEMMGDISEIKEGLMAFFKKHAPSAFYGYYADYDWVIFCWIFGKMIDLPNGFPKYCRDLKQMLDESGKDKIAAPIGEHNALVDAQWNKKLYEHLTS
jgi:hypothetical protein